MAKEVGDSKTQIFRFVRLNNLTPPLLQMVDDGKIALKPAVELSYLPEEQQEQLCDAIDMQECTPSLSQAQKMRQFSKDGRLDDNVILSIMAEEKPNQKEKIKVPAERLRDYIPRGLSPSKMEDYIVKAVEHYYKFLAGALIGLFRPDVQDFSEETALLTTTSVEDGSFSFTNIPYGSWAVKEISSPTGFVLSETVFPVEITEDGTIVEIEMENVRIRGTVQLTKVDRDYPDNKLTGAVFTVYEDTNGNQILDDGDKPLGLILEVMTGIYELTEIPYGHYLLQEDKAPNGFYLDTHVYPFSITEHGQTVIVENEAGKGFINAPEVGSLKIIKTSSNGRVHGFTFRITGPNGFDQTVTTDERGEIELKDLRLGEYTITEVTDAASADYVLPEPKTVEVKEGTTVKVEMHNVYRDTPQTGDTRNPALWMGICVGAILLAAICIFMGCRKK